MVEGSNTLGASQRLKSRKLIAALFNSGKAVTAGPLRVLHLLEPHADGGVQAGFSAPAKIFRHAVQRNRVKRLMREAWRLQQHTLRAHFSGGPDKLIIFLTYRGRDMPDQASMRAWTSEIIQKLFHRYVPRSENRE
jgi:ribonuclease P protein component